jgi:glycosyltransferase involved in cell wall biosynthesis
MLNVLYAGTLPPHPCGAAIACSRVLAGLAAQGNHVRAVAPITASVLRAGDSFARSCPAVDVRRFLVPHFHPTSPLATDGYRRIERTESLALVRALLAEQRPDVIVGRESFAWDLPGLSAENDIPCVVLAHGGTTFRLLDRGEPAAAARELLEQLRAATRIVAPADHLVARLRGLGLENVTRIPNAVDLESFRPERRDPALARRFAIGERDVVVAHLSNLVAIKRPLDVVESAARALGRRQELVYVVVGDGPYRGEMEKLCVERGIARSVRFVGWLDYERVPDYLRLADLVLVTSETEGQSLVGLEAQACGRTLIASDIPAAREVVTDGRTGLLFATGDVDDLTTKTLLAADDPSLRRSIGRAARRQVKRHSYQDAVSAYAELITEIAAGSS